MELDTDFCKVFCCEIPEVKKAVIPVECSMILPDYFPDVMKILRYTAKTGKFPVLNENGTETVSGNISIEVSYVSEEGELCSCSQLQPFSQSFDCGENIAAAEAEVAVSEIGCRAVNKRRIDLNGNIEISLHAVCGEEKKALSLAKGAGTVCKTESEEAVVFAGEFYKNFSIEEKGELGYGKPPFGKILRSAAFGEVTECHVIQDKIVTKGEVRVEMLWAGENSGENGIFLSKFSFPVSRMVEAKGILLTDICDAKYEADFPEITPLEDGQSVIVKLKIGISARVYRKERADFISDMFSTDYELKTEREKMSFIGKAFPISKTEQFSEKIDLPETAETVMDIWTENGALKFSSDGKAFFETKVCLFAKDSDGTPVYFEKAFERKADVLQTEENIVFQSLSVLPKNTDFVLIGDKKAEISSEILIDGTAFSSLSTETVKNCSLSTENKIEHGDFSVLLCYAEKGEKVWDIAKRHRSSVERIMTENDLSEETISERRMLVIT